MSIQNFTKTYTLITGATEGIGYELAKVFATKGHNLIIVARDEPNLAVVEQELRSHGVDVIKLSKDLFEPNAGFELYEEVSSQQLVVDILVNNAGQGSYGLFAETDILKELKIVQLNICSLLVLTKLFLKDMMQREEGRILNLSSIASKAPGPWHSVYHGTKAFVQSFTEALRSEVKDQGITVTALLPGATDTNFFENANMVDSKIAQDKDKLADPAMVALDGYEALMRGDDMIISGLKNKVDVAMGKVMPDRVKADKMKKQQEPLSGNRKL